MSTYRTQLPQLGDRLFLTDGGLETTLIFHDGIELPYFAAFDLLKNARGHRAPAPLLRALCARSRADAGPRHRAGEPDLARQPRLGREARLRRARRSRDANRQAIDLMLELRGEFEAPGRRW